MKLKLFISLVVAVTAFAVSVSTGTSAASDPLVDSACLTAPADATLFLGSGTSAVEVDSDFMPWVGDPLTSTSAYASLSRTCRNFVVDVQVPASALGAASRQPFSLTASTPSSYYWPFTLRCSSNFELTSVYRKLQGSSGGFTRLGTVTRRGEWVDELLGPRCRMVTSAESDPWPSTLDPPAMGTATYRVVTRASTFIPDSYVTVAHVLSLTRLVRAAHQPAS